MTAGTSPGGDRDWGIPEQPAGPAGRTRFHLEGLSGQRRPAWGRTGGSIRKREKLAAGVGLGKRKSLGKRGGLCRSLTRPRDPGRRSVEVKQEGGGSGEKKVCVRG